MAREGRRDRRIVLVLAAGLGGLLLLVLVVPDAYSELLANIERVRALRGLDLLKHEQSLDEVAWDLGWQSLCSAGGGAETVPMPQTEGVLEFSALASLDRGDYATAKALLEHLRAHRSADDEPNGLAYLAALDMDWVGAARSYEPQATPRHERWWGTVFYLAAQKLMFEGELDEAVELYRRADAAYGLHGPYLGLGLVECLVQRGQFLEAWDAYRRALVVMPPEEALDHLPRFGELRLEGLRTWYELDPENEQVEHWLEFYGEESRQEVAMTESLDEEPAPDLPLELDLGDGRTLLGFDYRVEDLETGPFMVVDFYVQEGEGEQAGYRRVRRTVLNQAPNGAFAWDRVPDGVRPVGWHAFVYSPDLTALVWKELTSGEAWLCLDAGRIGTSFGLQGNTAPLMHERPDYVQGGRAFPVGDASLSLGRTWFGVQETHNYSYVGGGRQPDQPQSMVGPWNPAAGADSVAVWLMAHQTSRGCFRELYLFALPNLASPGMG
jgi:tetratricopeptide (TPR) repeat protein